MKKPQLPVVLIHGQPGSSHDWNSVISLLESSSNPIIVVPDRPGYTLDEPKAMTVAGNARWLHGVLEKKDIKEAIFVAHSFGGAIALSFALQFPSRLSGMVLVSSSGTRSGLSSLDHVLALPGIGELTAATSILFVKKLIPLLQTASSPTTLPLVGQFLKNVPSQLVQDLPKSWLGIKLRSSPVWKSFAYEQRSLVRETPMLEDSLPSINIPTAVVHGLNDEIIPPNAGRDLARSLPRATLIEIGHKGHFLPYEDPLSVVDAIDKIQAQALLDS